MTFGAPPHHIESQLVAAMHILEIDAEFIHMPNIILVCFSDPEIKTSKTAKSGMKSGLCFPKGEPRTTKEVNHPYT